MVFTYLSSGTQTNNQKTKNSKDTYINEDFGFSIPKTKAWTDPVVASYDGLTKIQTNTYIIFIGYMYGRDGQALNYADIAYGHITPNTIQQQPDFFMIYNYPAAVVNTEQTKPFPSLIMLTIQRDDLIYIVQFPRMDNPNPMTISEINTVIEGFRFVGPVNKKAIRHTPKQIPDTARNTILLYPYNKQTIADSTPTLMFKLRQTGQEMVITSFDLKPLPYNEDVEFYFLTFQPSSLLNADVLIDEEVIDKVIAVPQFPTVECHDTRHYGDLGLYYNRYMYGGSLRLGPYTTKEECMAYKKKELPPILVFANPNRPLSSGEHTAAIQYKNGLRDEFSFTVNPNYSITPQTLPHSNNYNDPWYYKDLSITDICSRGYHFDPAYIQIPISLHENTNIHYRLSFSKPATSSQPSNIVGLTPKASYKLHIPQLSQFYLDKTQIEYEQTKIFLPIDILYFADGTNIEYSPGLERSEYFDLVPQDSSGRIYPASSIPWKTSSSSSCDG